jgi:hypothetical protein
MSSRLPRVRPIPDDFFNQKEEERREWAKQFLKDFVRPGEASSKPDEEED